MKYNLQLGCCLFTLLHLSHLSYFLYWFYKSLAFNFTTLLSYIHCILLWLSCPRVHSCIYMQDKLWEIISVPGDHESQRGPVVICAMIIYIQLYQHWAIHVCDMWSHFFYMYCSNNKVQMVVLCVIFSLLSFL